MTRQIVAMASGVALFLSLTYSPASSHVHRAADGTAVSWYPNECCNDGDCRPVVSMWVKDQRIWLTTEDGITLPLNPNQSRKPSLDNRWHLCVSFDERNIPFVRCVFEPANS